MFAPESVERLLFFKAIRPQFNGDKISHANLTHDTEFTADSMFQYGQKGKFSRAKERGKFLITDRFNAPARQRLLQHP